VIGRVIKKMKGDKQTGALVDIKGWAMRFIQKKERGQKK